MVVITSIRGLPDMLTLIPQACGPQALGMLISKTTCAHITTIKYPLYVLMLNRGYIQEV